MNYDNKYPTFSFRVDHNMKSKLDKLAIIKKISTNEFARQVITKYLNNDLVEKSDNLQTEKIKFHSQRTEVSDLMHHMDFEDFERLAFVQ